MIRKPSLAALALGAALVGASAQTASPPKPKAPVAAVAPSPQPSPIPTVAAPPPYDPQLLRLAELMGALSYLRDLCRDGDGAAFRDRLAKLMDVEAQTTERKEALAGAFNRGFGDYELTYRTCTSSARETIVRYLDEAQKIAHFVATRYGG
jgi:uncharacterized protein (TIGR02301 family)